MDGFSLPNTEAKKPKEPVGIKYVKIWFLCWDFSFQVFGRRWWGVIINGEVYLNRIRNTITDS